MAISDPQPRTPESQVIKRVLVVDNDRVCVEFDVDVEMAPDELPCKFSFRYRSVIAFGRAVEVADPAEKLEGLNLVMRHYTGRDWEFPDDKVARVAVVRVDIESMTGKSAGY